MTTELIGWRAGLCPGAIVSFRFPLGEGEGPSKMRPCLVIGSNIADGTHRITLAYGTSADSDSNRGLDLALAEPADWLAAGLRRPTRFVLMRRITVGLDDPGFNLHRQGGPVIGALPTTMLTVLKRMSRWLGSRMVEDRRRGSPRARAGVAVRRLPCPSRGQSPAAAVAEYRRHRRSSGQLPEDQREGRPSDEITRHLSGGASIGKPSRPGPPGQSPDILPSGSGGDPIAMGALA